VIFKKKTGWNYFGKLHLRGPKSLDRKIESRDLGKFLLFQKESCGSTTANVKHRAILFIKDQFFILLNEPDRRSVTALVAFLQRSSSSGIVGKV